LVLVAGPEKDEEPSGERSPPPDSDPSDVNRFTKTVRNQSSQASPNLRIVPRPTPFQSSCFTRFPEDKRSKLYVNP
jgi:hypothetical protein